MIIESISGEEDLTIAFSIAAKFAWVLSLLLMHVTYNRLVFVDSTIYM